MLESPVLETAEALAGSEGDVPVYAASLGPAAQGLLNEPARAVQQGDSNAVPTWSASSPMTSVILLVGACLLEHHDEWAVAERRCLSEESMALIDQHLEVNAAPDAPPLPAA